MLYPFRRLQYEPGRASYNKQLAYAVDWWLQALPSAPPRELPLDISTLPWVVSYSDGEGPCGGIGVAVWSSNSSRPQAGIMYIPNCIRGLWHKRCRDGKPHDIQDIEAVGPLVILETWPNILEHSLWVHFIDNNGALACLVCGSSSVDTSDVIVGMTLMRVSLLKVLPWFDRVDSQSNPVDGLSRGNLDGPWQLVTLSFPTRELERRLKSFRQ